MNFPTKLLACFTILLSSICSAEPPSIIITDQGYFLLLLNDGLPEIQKPARTIDTRTSTPTDPLPPGKPDTSPIPEVTKEVKDRAKAVNDSDTAQALALVYRQVNDSYQENTWTPQKGASVLSAASDAIIKSNDWDDFRKYTTDVFNERLAKGGLVFDDFALAVAIGLELAADGSNALDFNKVIEVVNSTNNAIDQTK